MLYTAAFVSEIAEMILKRKPHSFVQMNAKIFFGIALVFLLFVLLGCANPNGNASLASGKTAKIGVIVPLTGTQAPYGEGIKEGLELAVGEINTSDAKFPVKIELVYEDNSGDVKNSVSAAQKMINIDNVALLISGSSQHSVAVAPVAQQNKTVLYAMASQATSLNHAGDYVFKNDSDALVIGEKTADFAFKKGYEKVAVLFAEYNDTTVDSKNSFVKKFEERGGETVAVEAISKEATDYRAQLSKIKSSNPGFCFFGSFNRQRCACIKANKRNRFECSYNFKWQR